MPISIARQIRSGVAFVTLSAADGQNMLGGALVSELTGVLRETAADSSCRAIVIGATGAHFCRGVDLAAAIGDGRGDRGLLSAIADCFLLITRVPQPVIACVEGHVTGGGIGLVAASDLVLAADCATFTLSEVIVGMIPALVTPLLLRRMAPGRVRYMALGTKPVTAGDARDFGLVDAVAPAADLQSLVDQQLQRLLRSSPDALRETKRYLDSLTPDIEVQLRAGVERLFRWLDDQAVIDGVGSFAAGAVPRWFQRYEGGRRA